MLRAVLDANIFVSAAINPKGKPAEVVGQLEADMFRLVIAESILAEVDRVFRYPRIAERLGWSEEQLLRLVATLRRTGFLTTGGLTLEVVSSDPSDNRYLECAVEGRADYIVSGDAHLLSLVAYEGIRIVTPAEFLGVLRG